MPLHRELLIGGKETPAASGRRTDDISPVTGLPYATVAAAGPEDVRAAVEAADAAFAGWAALGPYARRTIFLTAADLLQARAEQAVELMAGEAGGTRPWALFNVGLAAQILREAAAAVTAPRGDVLAAQEPGALGLAVREPLGVVAAFAPWNAPLILGVRAVAAPLAAGNTVVMKPSEDAPLACGLFVADVLRDVFRTGSVLPNRPQEPCLHSGRWPRTREHTAVPPTTGRRGSWASSSRSSPPTRASPRRSPGPSSTALRYSTRRWRRSSSATS